MIHHRHDSPSEFDTLVERRPRRAPSRPGPPAPPGPAPGFGPHDNGPTRVDRLRRSEWVRPTDAGPSVHRVEPADPPLRVEIAPRPVERDAPPEFDYVDAEFEELDGSDIVELDPRDVEALTFAEAIDADTRAQLSPGIRMMRSPVSSPGDGFDLDLEFDERFRAMTRFVRLSRRAQLRRGWVERVDAFGERVEHAVRRLADALSRRLRALAAGAVARSSGAHLDGPPRL